MRCEEEEEVSLEFPLTAILWYEAPVWSDPLLSNLRLFHGI